MSTITLPEEFPRAWDSTIHSAWKGCKHKWWRKHVLGLKSKGSSIHLHAGGAFAHAVETVRKAYYAKGFSAEDSVALGIDALARKWGLDPLVTDDHNKSLPNMQYALIKYFDHHQLGVDRLIPHQLSTGPAIEVNFAFPLPINHPDTGEPILYCGRFDMLANDSGLLWVVDEKTTGQLGATWSSKWELRAQFIGYALGAQMYGVKVAGAIVRGIALYKNDVGFAEAIVQRPQWMIDEWIETLYSDINDAINYWKLQKFPKVFDDTCNAYGGCPFHRLCTTPNPEPFIEAYYEIDHWNPLDFGKGDAD